MSPMKLIMILQLVAHGLAHWMCDLVGVTCDAVAGTEMCFSHFANNYVLTNQGALYHVTSRLKCSALCLSNGNCLCLLFING